MGRTLRKIFQISCLYAFIMPIATVTAQNSGFFNYQAVVSDPEGKPYEGTVGVRITILQPVADGDVVYSERHTRETETGFVSFRVGEGDQVYTGKFDTINWSAGPSFIRTEIAPGGGYSYSMSATSELASVPLALFARTAESIDDEFVESDPVFSSSVASLITAEDTLRWNMLSRKAQFRIGDLHEGGIIFYLEPNGENGLVVSLYDIAEGVTWGAEAQETGAESNYDGVANTTAIINFSGAGDYAAYKCDTLVLNGYDDWYLPAPDEMYLLFRARYELNKILELDGNEDTGGIVAEEYWTSKERNDSEAYLYLNGHLDLTVKDYPANVRAIRAF
jgi:hypothetical protein